MLSFLRTSADGLFVLLQGSLSFEDSAEGSDADSDGLEEEENNADSDDAAAAEESDSSEDEVISCSALTSTLSHRLLATPLLKVIYVLLLLVAGCATEHRRQRAAGVVQGRGAHWVRHLREEDQEAGQGGPHRGLPQERRQR